MTSKIDFKALMAQARESDDYWVEKAVLDFTEDVVERMKGDSVSRSELARRIGKSPAYITKLLRGDNNFTLHTMVKLARVLDCQLSTHLHPKESRCHWFDVSPAREKAPFKSGAQMRALKDSYRPRKDLATDRAQLGATG